MSSVSEHVSLYERLGGGAGIEKAVEVFYRKVLGDDRISAFFDGLEMEGQMVKMKAFLVFAFGGPVAYTGRDMRKSHAHLVADGITDEHFDAVVEHLSSTLRELGAGDAEVQELTTFTEKLRDDILGR